MKFLDLKAVNAQYRSELIEACTNVIDSGWYIQGPQVEAFEREFAGYCGTKHCIGVANGLDALTLTIRAWLELGKLKEGDEVIVPANTYIASILAITENRLVPVMVEPDASNYNLCPKNIKAAITPKTKVILPVHLYGQPVEMDRINGIAKKHGLIVIEDAAQAHAATYKGKRVGNLGNTTCFSFYPGKNLGAYGEGGAVVTDDENIAGRIRILRDHGQSKKYCHDFVGYNYRMDGFQGAVLSVKLKYLQEWTDKRNDIARRYSEGLKDIDGLQVPYIRDDIVSAFHLYVIHTPKRDELMTYLQENGIAAGLHYPIPIHLQKAYKHLNQKKGDFPFAEKNAVQCLSLPMYADMTDEQIEMVIDSIG